MASTIFNLGGVKILKNILRFQTSDVQIITGQAADPTVTAVDAVAGSIYIRNNGEVYIKNTSGNNTDFRRVSDQAALDAHVNALTDAHDASAISNVPAGNLAATNVQDALNELQSDIDTRATQTALSDHLNDAVDAHDASAISSVPAGNLAATDVQSALNELQSDIDTRALDADVIKKDGSVAFTGNQSMGGFKLTGLGAPTAATDAATKEYVDNALEGLRPKEAVRVATTADITLSGLQTIDGVSVVAGNRVLVKDQSLPENNGIYVAASGAWSRATDFDSLTPIDEINKAYVAVQEGTANAGKLYVQFGVVASLGVDPINFTFFNSVSGLIGGDGITVSGSNISVDHDGQGLDFVAGQLALELDGATLSKSAAGVKVADGGISNLQINAAAAIAYSKLNLANSIVDADIAAAAAINATKIGNGDVDNTELSYLNGVTSAIQTQLDEKANQALSNLTSPTAINQHLLPNSSGLRNLGSDAFKFGSLYLSDNAYITETTIVDGSGNYKGRFNITAGVATPDAGQELVAIHSGGTFTSTRVGVYTPNSTDANANPTSAIFIGTGNKTAGTGNSGSISIRTGTSAGGTRGTINLIDASLASAAVGYVWSLANTTTGAGNWVAAPAGYTDEQAQDAVGNILVDSSKIDFTYDDVANTITATIVAGSLVDADINAAAAIALSKLAAVTADRALVSNGSGVISASAVTATELGYVSGVTSSIQTQLDDKHAKGATDFVFATNAAMGSNVTNEVITGLTFAHASYNGCMVDYRIKKGTLVRTGRFLVSTDGTNVAFNDMFVETLDSSVVFEAVINGSNINIRHTNTETGTMQITFEQTLFPV